MPSVAVPAGLAEHAHRDLHARPDDQAAAHRLGDAQVGAAGVADVRDALRERPAQVVHGLVERVAERRLQLPQGVDAADHDVHVAVEQPGQHRGAGAVDLLVAVQAGAHLDHPAVLDHDVAARGRAARAVDHRSTPEHPPHHGATLGPTR